ncbi:MAG: DNA-directed RNA polymerase subunit omega [Hydrogenobaculum sp.]|nr:MAG: DNA-directed RNA polymerase subunit omega [Hydrogenobaculum sp.]PMP92523.1 MAG: DNA-directed RNA polymerase subunit omega [Hydrogenobaculum sp.]HEK24874.1 DNA-directed RNA polymerase subunit omega [Hydrogenobaculum sp.]
MSSRPKIYEALKKVNNKYELVHAAVKYTEKLMQEDDSSFIRGKRELIKKTFFAINRLADSDIEIKITEENEEINKNEEIHS